MRTEIEVITRLAALYEYLNKVSDAEQISLIGKIEELEWILKADEE